MAAEDSMSLHFANPLGLVAAVAMPLLWLWFRRGDRGRAAALARWNGFVAAPPSIGRRALYYMAALLLALALARPSWRPVTTETVRAGDIVFLLDVSRSMLATDARPSRLARAKAAARAIADEAHGQRVALVAFSGSQSVECPLTVDHAFFGEMLEGATRDSVARGGTDLAAAIRFTLAQVFDDVLRGSRSIALLTDGGDSDPEAIAAAREAAASGVSVVAIGFGDETTGAQVPGSAGPLLYKGQPVRTRLNSAMLRAVAGDAYVSGDGLDAPTIYRGWLAPKGESSRERESGDIGWLLCLAAAALVLAIEPRVPERRQRAAAALLLGVLLLPRPSFAQTVEEWFAKGLDALKRGDAQDAMHYFGDTSRWAPDVPEIRFNLAKSLYEYKAFHEAAVTFDEAVRLSRDRRFQSRCRLGQGNAMFRESEALPPSAPIQAIERLEQSVAAYREALRLDPQTPDAPYNIEVARRRLEQLRDRAFARPMDAQRPVESPRQVLERSSKAAPALSTRAAGKASERDW
jgi:Ca-activated chloride channel family protein